MFNKDFLSLKFLFYKDMKLRARACDPSKFRDSARVRDLSCSCVCVCVCVCPLTFFIIILSPDVIPPIVSVTSLTADEVGLCHGGPKPPTIKIYMIKNS